MGIIILYLYFEEIKRTLVNQLARVCGLKRGSDCFKGCNENDVKKNWQWNNADYINETVEVFLLSHIIFIIPLSVKKNFMSSSTNFVKVQKLDNYTL